MDSGQEDYEGPAEVKVITQEARNNRGTPYVLCQFSCGF